MFYKPRYFKIEELVDEETYKRFGETALRFFNPLALQGLDNLREFIGEPLIVNNWANGGGYQFSGFRPKWCNVGATYSQHRLGQAFDIKTKKTPVEDVYHNIISNSDSPLLEHLTEMEDIEYTGKGASPWLHVAFTNIPDRIKIVKP